ncbi:hypothetical protein IW262DRAFT_1302980 [Armillaria fumosa]|nr:hypothetical protein IW262DRAFT_1302980 [Armillaria fumosa]
MSLPMGTMDFLGIDSSQTRGKKEGSKGMCLCQYFFHDTIPHDPLKFKSSCGNVPATHSLTGSDSATSFSLANQAYEKQLLATRSLTHTGNDSNRSVSLRMQEYEKLLLHLEEWMDRNGSALAKDGYAIERHIFRAHEPQALECHQDEQSMGTKQLTLEGSVSDRSDGTVDTSMTAQIRHWRASISETMDSAVDQGLESKIAFIVELRER